ncbi:MAG: DUF480 domain-containing protein [Pseudomonadales bacterium]
MNVELDPVEARIIGSLMEKSVVTPEQYPLSLNALISACNQKSSREPVMTLAERQVAEVLERLQKRYLVREKSGFGGRVPKYHYRLYNDEIGDFRFSPAERAVICLLLLRGPQTPGELRSRAGRLHEFTDVNEVEATLQGLADSDHGPFVVRLTRQPGRREARYAQLFTELPAETEIETSVPPSRPAAAAPPAGAGAQVPAAVPDGLAERLEVLEARVAALEAAVEAALADRNSGVGDGR